MSSIAAGTVRFAAALLPRAMRDRYREQWLADVSGADEAGVSRAQVAVGSLAFAVTYDRPLRVRAANVEKRARLAAGLALSAALVALSAYASVVTFGGLTGVGWFDFLVFITTALLILFVVVAPIAAVVIVSITRGISSRVRLAVWLLAAACLAPVAGMAIDAPNQSIGDIYFTPGTGAYVVGAALVGVAVIQLWRAFARPASHASTLLPAIVGGVGVVVVAGVGLVASGVLWLQRTPPVLGPDTASSAYFTAEWYALEAAAEQRVLATWIGLAVGSLLLAGTLVIAGRSRRLSPNATRALGAVTVFTVLIAVAAFFSFLELMLSMLESSVLVSVMLIIGRWGIALTTLFAVSGLRLARRVQARPGVQTR